VNLTLVSKVFAYLDPGTGNLLLQALLAAIMGAFILVGFLRKQARELLLKIFKKGAVQEPDPVETDDTDDED